MKWRAGLATVGVLVLAVWLRAAFDDAGQVEIVRLQESNWDRFVPEGKEVDAIYGDLVIRNKFLTAVIAQPRADRNANMTVRTIGGALIDLTVRDAQSDQLAAWYPGKRTFAFRSGAAVMDAGEEIALKGVQTHQGKAGTVIMRAVAGENTPAVEVRYQLGAADRFLTISTRYTNSSKKPLTVNLQDDMRIDGGNEDQVRKPNGTSDTFWVHDRYWGQAYGILSSQLPMQHNTSTRTTTFGYRTDSGSSITLEAGKSFEISRKIFPGANLLDVQAITAELKGEKVAPVSFTIRDAQGKPIPHARLNVLKGNRSFGTATANAGGVIQTRIPPGDYFVQVAEVGVEITKGTGLTIRVTEDPNTFVFNLDYDPAIVQAEITDEDGNPIPCKVEFQPKDGTPRPDFGPNSADFTVKNLCYAPHGKFTQRVPAGSYDVIISRGPEYDAIFTTLEAKPASIAKLTGKLKRVVDTTGWVSSDFHSHSSPSGDNTGSQLGRVLNLVCEQIEFAPCTEHNRVSTYVPHFKSLKIEPWISTVSGMELTGQPLPLNHQNVFPIVHKPRTQDGGGPVTDTDPEKQIERIALWDNRSEKLIQQNHPDLGWLIYDKNGDGKPDQGYARSIPFMDVMEIHPVQDALHLGPDSYGTRKFHNRVFNWLQLLNQGYRIYGVVNTDAHYNYHGSGGVRIWIQSSTDDPAKISADEMRIAAEQGRVIMSNGPYLEVSMKEKGSSKNVVAGQDLKPGKPNQLELAIKVQCPNWVDVDQVTVLINGRPHAKHHYTREKTPDKFRSGVVKFDETLSLSLDKDAHVVVVTGAPKRTLGPVMGPSWGKQQPAALSNPIFVDVDGNGFVPNKDTLGFPLPVKYGTRK